VEVGPDPGPGADLVRSPCKVESRMGWDVPRFQHHVRCSQLLYPESETEE
jgi:hypothetical protein